jgi:hypothetical protein
METYELTQQYVDGAGNHAQNVFHYNFNDSASPDPFSAAKHLIDKWQTVMVPAMLPLFAADVMILNVAARRVSGLGGFTYIEDVGSNGSYPSSSTFSAAMACDVMYSTSVLPWRAGHTYVPYLPANAVTIDALVTAYLTPMEAWNALMLAPLILPVEGDATFGRYTRKTKEFTPFTGATIRPKITPMNRRLLPAYS